MRIPLFRSSSSALSAQLNALNLLCWRADLERRIPYLKITFINLLQLGQFFSAKRYN